MSLLSVDGDSAAAWILEAGADMRDPLVKHQIPARFETLVRVLHPAFDVTGERISWGRLARERGGRLHPEVQWHCLLGTDDPVQVYELWKGERPAEGELEEFELGVLIDVLQAHTATPENCFFGLSTIHGWVEDLVAGRRLFSLPYRQFGIFQGPLDRIGELGAASEDAAQESDTSPEAIGSDGLRLIRSDRGLEGDANPPEASPSTESLPQGREQVARTRSTYGQAPNLLWPSDHAWCVATEMDFDSTLVAGSEVMTKVLLEMPGLECVRVARDDSLGWNADRINCRR